MKFELNADNREHFFESRIEIVCFFLFENEGLCERRIDENKGGDLNKRRPI